MIDTQSKRYSHLGFLAAKNVAVDLIQKRALTISEQELVVDMIRVMTARHAEAISQIQTGKK